MPTTLIPLRKHEDEELKEHIKEFERKYGKRISKPDFLVKIVLEWLRSKKLADQVEYELSKEV